MILTHQQAQPNTQTHPPTSPTQHTNTPTDPPKIKTLITHCTQTHITLTRQTCHTLTHSLDSGQPNY